MTPSPDSKKIFLFSSKGGNGHESACSALEASLKNYFFLQRFYPFQSLKPFSLLNQGSSHHQNGEAFYNFLLQKKWSRIANLYARVGSWLIKLFSGLIEKEIRKMLIETRPDIVISVIPFINAYLFKATQELKIPFLIFTCDLDTFNYVKGFETLSLEQIPDFKYFIAFDEPLLYEKIAPAKLPRGTIEVSGFPLRKDFFVSYERQSVLSHFNLPAQKPIVLLMMGGTGSSATYAYAKEIARLNLSLHLVVCLGRNKRMRALLEKLHFNSGISVSLLDYTDEVAALMSVSSLLITKPGPSSIVEAIYSHLPMVLDNTSTPLYWEKLNTTFVLEKGFGFVARDYQEIGAILKNCFEEKTVYETIKQNLKAYPKPHFESSLKKIFSQWATLP